jgi:hypothetical protein
MPCKALALVRRLRPVRVRILSLGLATLATLAVAAIRITHAADDHNVWVREPPGYGTTAADALSTLQEIKTPPGFTRSARCSGPSTACFVRSKSLVLTTGVMARLMASTGATLYTTTRLHDRLPLIECVTAKLQAQPSFQSCSLEATVKNELLRVSANSAIMSSHGQPQPTARTPRGFAYPLELTVYVIGHPLSTGGS